MRIFFLFFASLLFCQDIDVNSNMVFISGNEYLMGKDSEKNRDFSPSHEVNIASFYIDKYEVTNKEYIAFCKDTGHVFPLFWNTTIFKCGDDFMNYPVIGVSWKDAYKYAAWAGKRLPTEAEWEYAARGGLQECDYPNGNKWEREKHGRDTTNWNNMISPVDAYEPNGYGLYNMSGNVWEWVSDKYSATYYAESKNNNPKGPVKGNLNVIRGGSWVSGPGCLKVYFRKGLPVIWTDFAVGFRCAKDNSE